MAKNFRISLTSKKTKLRYTLGKVTSLGSSSDGNAYVLEIYRKNYPNPYRLMIECGFSYSILSRKLLEKNMSINDIHAILVTHEHLDHCESTRDLIKRGKKVYAPLSVFKKFNLEVDKKYIMKEHVEKGLSDGIRVMGIPLDHEGENGENVYNLGYIITIDGDFKILFVIDTKSIQWDLSEYEFNVIFIEANYLRRTMYWALKDAKEKKSYMQYHFQRVLKSHMSVENTAKTLCQLNLKKCDTVFTMHITTNTIANPFEYREIIETQLRKYKRLRYFQRTHKGQKTIFSKPKIRIFKKNGELI